MKKIITSFLLASTLFGATLDEVKSSGVLKVGVYDSNPPFSKVNPDGSYEGFEIKMIEKIAADLFGTQKYKLQLVPLISSDRIPSLQEDRVDFVLANFTETEERKKFIDFTAPYFSVNFGVLTKKGSGINVQSDLIGKTILVEKDSTGAAYFEKNGYKVKYCTQILDCYNMLKNDEGDAFGHDNVVVMAYPVIDHSVEVKIKNIGKTDFLAIGVKKGNTDMFNFLNNEMIKLSKEGFFKKIFDEDIVPFYKESAEKKYFLLEDLYNVLFNNLQL